MHQSESGLAGVADARCVAAIGGGGKTSVLAALRRDALTAGRQVVLTTTTRIFPPLDGVVVIAGRDDCRMTMIAATLGATNTCTVARGVTADGKLIGVDAAWVCELADAVPTALTLVEADGSAGRPIKVHGKKEPVIPACSDIVLMVAGMWACGSRVDEHTVHRVADLAKLPGIRSSDTIDESLIAGVLLSYRPVIPPHARPVVVLNGASTPMLESAARQVSDCLKEEWPEIDVIVMRLLPRDAEHTSGGHHP